MLINLIQVFQSRYTITHEAIFDVVIKENVHTDEILSKGKIIIGLFGDIVPMTVLKFCYNYKWNYSNQRKIKINVNKHLFYSSFI